MNCVVRNFNGSTSIFAVGISESIVDKVRAYIRGQEKHHSRQPFEVEFDQMIKKFGFERFEDDDK